MHNSKAHRNVGGPLLTGLLCWIQFQEANYQWFLHDEIASVIFASINLWPAKFYLICTLCSQQAIIQVKSFNNTIKAKKTESSLFSLNLSEQYIIRMPPQNTVSFLVRPAVQISYMFGNIQTNSDPMCYQRHLAIQLRWLRNRLVLFRSWGMTQ